MFLQRLNNLILSKKITKNKMLTDLGLSKNSFVDWKQRGTIPNGETLKKIADYFGVSVDYLLGKENASAIELSKQEQYLLDNFRSLNDAGKDYILQTMDMVKDKYKKSDTASNLEMVVG